MLATSLVLRRAVATQQNNLEDCKDNQSYGVKLAILTYIDSLKVHFNKPLFSKYQKRSTNNNVLFGFLGTRHFSNVMAEGSIKKYVTVEG